MLYLYSFYLYLFIITCLSVCLWFNRTQTYDTISMNVAQKWAYITWSDVHLFPSQYTF